LIKARDYSNLIYAIPGYSYKIASDSEYKTDSVLENLTGSDWILASGGEGIRGWRTYLEVACLGSDYSGFILLLDMCLAGADGKAHRTHY
jgi:hypothetical protein